MTRIIQRRPILPTLLLLPLAACGSGQAASGVAARDSAGIAIVQVGDEALRAAPEWRLEERPSLDIGVVEGDAAQQLDRVAGAAWLADGRIVVANAGTGELRFFGPDGRHLGSAGRLGGGPGEFRSMDWLAVGRGDTVLVHDGRQGRISVFGADGRAVRTLRLQGDGEPLLLAPAGLFGDGSLLVRGVRSMAGLNQGGVVRDSALYLRYSRAGAPLDTLGTLPHASRVVSRQGGFNTVLDAPLAPEAAVAVDGPGFWFASGETAAVERLSRRGVRVRSVRWPGGDLRLSAAERDRFRQERIAAAEPRWRAAVTRSLDAAPLPERLPAVSRLVPGAEGDLWVRAHPRPGRDSVPWVVFRGDGRVRARLVLPRGTDVLAVRADTVLVAERDELDVEHVRVRAIRQPRR